MKQQHANEEEEKEEGEEEEEEEEEEWNSGFQLENEGLVGGNEEKGRIENKYTILLLRAWFFDKKNIK